jgi:LacI family transcriptional regulator
MAVNQKQIAERLGVSISLVSRVLSGNAREIGIADATIDRVVEVAREMGYVPNVAARTLKGKDSNTIGVVVYDFQDPFFGISIEQLQSVAHEQGYSLVLAGFQGRHPVASDLAPLHKHAISGLVVLGSADYSDWLEGFSTMPVVRIGHGDTSEQSVRVTIDEDDAARQLLDHLAARNCGSCIYIGSELFAHKLRYQAMERAVEKTGMRITKQFSSNQGFFAGFQTTNKIASEATDSPALICATDLIAMGALHALHNADLQWPVSGFDDIPTASQFIPSITTVRQPIEAIVNEAFSSIVQSIPPTEVLLPGKLVVRSSA